MAVDCSSKVLTVRALVVNPANSSIAGSPTTTVPVLSRKYDTLVTGDPASLHDRERMVAFEAAVHVKTVSPPGQATSRAASSVSVTAAAVGFAV